MVNKETLKMNCKIRKKLNKFDIIKLIFAYIIISITCPLLMKNNNTFNDSQGLNFYFSPDRFRWKNTLSVDI